MLQNFLEIQKFLKNLEKKIESELMVKENNLKIWSAACSTGDEPYSLAMLLSKFLPQSNIHVYATDIDNEVLDKAKIGLYNEKSLKEVPKEFLLKYFKKINSNTYQISDQIKSCVSFTHHNLLRDEYMKQCNLIVCRNVLIYFTEAAKEEIYHKFNSSLKQDGIFFVGSTEQIIQPQKYNFSSYQSFFYKKI